MSSEIVKPCINCCNYDWALPTDKSTIQQCSSCKFGSYCSTECQKEHWVKVHRKQCKYLAGRETLPLSRHVQAVCPGCRDETVTPGPEDPANPTLGCHMPKDFVPFIGSKGVRYTIPFQLSEMTGKFQSKPEETVSLMHRIVNKMLLTMHPIMTICYQDVQSLFSVLIEIRHMINNIYCIFNPGRMVELKISDNLAEDRHIPKIKSLIKIIDSKLALVSFTDEFEFKPWETFKIMFHFLDTFIVDTMRKKAEAVGLPEMTSDQQKMMVTSDQFNAMWIQVLDSMPGKLISYHNLVKMVCGGSLEKKCTGCSKDVIISRVDYLGNEQWSRSFKDTTFVDVCDIYLCGEIVCLMKVVNDLVKVREMYVMMNVADSLCDRCKMACRKLIMCNKCRTKQYCGLECKEKDWNKVHKDVCSEGEVKRKKKVNRNMTD